jgi:hypothetical protein
MRAPADLVLGRVARGEEEDGEMGARVAQAPGDLEPVDARHHDVQDDEVGRELLDCVEGVAPVAGDAHIELLVAQRHRDEVGDAGLVVDDQHARRSNRCLDHADPPLASGSTLAPTRIVGLFPERCLRKP